MGVKQCDRNGCENVMSDYCSQKYGYLCADCFIEMKKLEISIQRFMSLPKYAEPNYDYDGEFENDG